MNVLLAILFLYVIYSEFQISEQLNACHSHNPRIPSAIWRNINPVCWNLVPACERRETAESRI
jgi:hypothetical protein